MEGAIVNGVFENVTPIVFKVKLGLPDNLRFQG